MKIYRMIGILSVLLQKDGVAAPYLSEKFEVSVRTINRDIEALCMAGIPIVSKRGPSGGFSIMDGYKIDRTALTSSDMQSILAGLRSLDSASGTNRYAELMEKLSVSSSNFIEGKDNILIDLSSWQKTTLPPKIDLIRDAINASTEITFSYCSSKGESTRTIEPYYLIFQWSSWYVWGFCLEREDFRLFKLNRMYSIKTGDSFEKRSAPKPDLSPEKVFPHYYQIKARISPKYKWRLVEEYGVDSFVEDEDGTLIFSFGFTDKENIVRWIASFGGGAELLSPAELRESVAYFAEKIKEKHAP